MVLNRIPFIMRNIYYNASRIRTIAKTGKQKKNTMHQKNFYKNRRQYSTMVNPPGNSGPNLPNKFLILAAIGFISIFNKNQKRK